MTGLDSKPEKAFIGLIHKNLGKSGGPRRKADSGSGGPSIKITA